MNAIRRRRPAGGVTLVELVVAILILSIASVGALTYQYHAVRRAVMARAEITAAELGRLLIEDWKSAGGDSSYDPSDLDVGIESVNNSPTFFKVTQNGFPMWITLWYQDMVTDAAAGVTLRQIRLTVQWNRQYKDEVPSAQTDPTYVTATYVRRDTAGG